MRNKVLLIFPPFSKPALVDYAPIGITSLAPYLLREVPGTEVTLIDGTNTRYEEKHWVQLFQSIKPDIVGLSMVTLNYPSGAWLARLAKATIPNALVVMGGVHVVITVGRCCCDR